MPDRTTQNVSLTPELEHFVRELLATGRYQSASEVVREGLRQLEQAERRRLLEKAILGGLTAEEESRLPTELQEKARADVRAKIQEGIDSLARGDAVAKKTRRKKIVPRVRKMDATKHCQHCGNLFKRGPTEGRVRWEARRFCGRDCTRQGRSRSYHGPLTSETAKALNAKRWGKKDGKGGVGRPPREATCPFCAEKIIGGEGVRTQTALAAHKKGCVKNPKAMKTKGVN